MRSLIFSPVVQQSGFLLYLLVHHQCHSMENKVTLMMKEQHTLKMVVGYEVGKAFSRSAVFESSFLVWLRQAVLLPHQPLPPVYNIGATARGTGDVRPL
jgi:hypothetical protein